MYICSYGVEEDPSSNNVEEKVDEESSVGKILHSTVMVMVIASNSYRRWFRSDRLVVQVTSPDCILGAS